MSTCSAITVSIGNHAMLLVQLGINSTRDVWKFCQNWTRLFVMLIISIGNHAMLLVQLGINSTVRVMFGNFAKIGLASLSC